MLARGLSVIDDHKILRDYLVADAGLSALVSTRIYAARDVPPEGYKPSTGSCLVFKRRGGPPTDESGQVIVNSYQFKCYGSGGNDNQQVINAEAVYRALYDALHFQSTYDILGAEEESRGSSLPETDTGWMFVLAFFRVRMRKTA